MGLTLRKNKKIKIVDMRPPDKYFDYLRPKGKILCKKMKILTSYFHKLALMVGTRLTFAFDQSLKTRKRSFVEK